MIQGVISVKSLFTNNPSAAITSSRVLYTPSTFARASLLHLQETGTLTAVREHTSERNGLRSFLFIAVLDGEGELKYGGKVYRLSKGKCAFIDCHKPYSHTTSKNLWTLKWCHFYGPSLASFYEKYTESGGKPAFLPSDFHLFLNLLDHLNQVAQNEDLIRDMEINEALSHLCTLLMTETRHAESYDAQMTKRQSAADVKEYLDQHYADRITLDELSSYFFVNKYYLCKMFKDQVGTSVIAYLLDVRITHAKQMLRFTDQSVEEIGIECGLGALHYFSRIFKKIEGVPPSVYRRQWSK